MVGGVGRVYDHALTLQFQRLLVRDEHAWKVDGNQVSLIDGFLSRNATRGALIDTYHWWVDPDVHGTTPAEYAMRRFLNTEDDVSTDFASKLMLLFARSQRDEAGACPLAELIHMFSGGWTRGFVSTILRDWPADALNLDAVWRSRQITLVRLLSDKNCEYDGGHSGSWFRLALARCKAADLRRLISRSLYGVHAGDPTVSVLALDDLLKRCEETNALLSVDAECPLDDLFINCARLRPHVSSAVLSRLQRLMDPGEWAATAVRCLTVLLMIKQGFPAAEAIIAQIVTREQLQDVDWVYDLFTWERCAYSGVWSGRSTIDGPLGALFVRQSEIDWLELQHRPTRSTIAEAASRTSIPMPTVIDPTGLGLDAVEKKLLERKALDQKSLQAIDLAQAHHAFGHTRVETINKEESVRAGRKGTTSLRAACARDTVLCSRILDAERTQASEELLVTAMVSCMFRDTIPYDPIMLLASYVSWASKAVAHRLDKDQSITPSLTRPSH
jgi:hypothetical protein